MCHKYHVEHTSKQCNLNCLKSGSRRGANLCGACVRPTDERSLVRVEFLLKTDSGYPKDTGVDKPWQPLGIPFAITPIGQLHQYPPLPIQGDLGRGPSHQSHVLEHGDTYGQAQVCSKGHQGSSVEFVRPVVFFFVVLPPHS